MTNNEAQPAHNGHAHDHRLEDLKTQVGRLMQLVEQWKFTQALDELYSDELISHENEEAPRIGLASYREAVLQFLGNATDHSATPLQVIIGDNVSAILWHYRFGHPATGPMDYQQLSVQRWKNGRIVHERHHYMTPQWS